MLNKIGWIGNGGNYFSRQYNHVSYKAFPSAEVNLPPKNSLIFRSIYVSISAGIKNFRSLWSTHAIGMNIVSIVSKTDVCTGLCAKISNSELPTMLMLLCLRHELSRLGKDVSFYILLLRLLICTSNRLFLFLFCFSSPVSLRNPFTFASWPLSFFITLCANSAMFLRRMSRLFGLGSVFWAISIIMFRSVNIALNP